MKLKDYEDYQKNNVKASKSQLKEYIQIYAEMAKKLKSENKTFFILPPQSFTKGSLFEAK